MARRFVMGLALAMFSIVMNVTSASADGWPPFP
jgi:hypothetical protein